MEIHCNLCGKILDETSDSCPGCGTARAVLEADVQLPSPRGAVNDFAGILNESQSGELSSMVTSFFKKMEVPIVLATVHSTGRLQPAEYAFLLFNHWGIGLKNVNRGILILLSLKDRHLESEIGLGLEDFISEEEGDEIVGKFTGKFSDGRFFEGLRDGLKVLIHAVEKRLPSVH